MPIIREYPNSQYRFEFFVNYGKQTFQQIKKAKGCYAIVNMWYYDMKAYAKAKTVIQVDASTASDVTVDGRQLKKHMYKDWGVTIDASGNLGYAINNGTELNYATGCPAQYIAGQKYCMNAKVESNGCTHIGFKADGTPMIAIASKDKPETNDSVNQAMLKAGASTIIRMDGSWSSQGDLGDVIIQPSQLRIVQGYLLIYKRNEDTKPQKETTDVKKKYLVCIDPGHGTQEPNCSADKTYYEYQYAWKLSQALKELLINSGEFDVILTKNNMNDTPSLTSRAAVANGKHADICISEHTNAESTGRCSGATAWTYASGGSRETLAKAILDQYTVNGIPLFGSKLYNKKFTILAETNMPAVLMETYFHTSAADLVKLKNEGNMWLVAYAQACGICKYFGLSTAYIQKPGATQAAPTESAWIAWAKANGISDCTRLTDVATRDEVIHMLYNLVDKVSKN